MNGRLFLFAKDRHDESYFVYYSTTLDAPPESSSEKYRDRKRLFTLTLFDVNGRKYEFPLDVRNHDQSVKLHFKFTLRDRWEALKAVFRRS
jgi:hypothetical protein